MGKEKLDQEIQNKLFSANPEQTISALKSIQEKGNKLYLPILFNLLVSNPEPETKKEILKTLGTVKKNDAVPVFVEALCEKKYQPIRKQLLIACWQNGLDFKEHLPLLIDIIIEEDWESGFEAFTIVENMKTLPEQPVIDEATVKINQSIDTVNEKKQYFLHEILQMIR